MSTQPKKEDVFLILGERQSEPVWYYVWVEKRKQPLIKHRDLADAPDDLGHVLYWGLGTEPPLYLREKVAKGDFSA